MRICKNTVLLGWKDFVKLFKENSNFWHKIWENAGHPTACLPADLGKCIRYRYHWTIRQIEEHLDAVIKNKTTVY